MSLPRSRNVIPTGNSKIVGLVTIVIRRPNLSRASFDDTTGTISRTDATA